MSRTTYLPGAPHAQGHSVEHFTGRSCRRAARRHRGDGAGRAGCGARSATSPRGRLLAGRRPDVLAPGTLQEMGIDRVGSTRATGSGCATRLSGERDLVGHTGSMPGFLASLFVEPDTGDGAVAMANATTGLDCEGVPEALLGRGPESSEQWRPTVHVPEEVAGLLGTWFWGSTAVDLRWHNETLQLWRVQAGTLSDTFALAADCSSVSTVTTVARRSRSTITTSSARPSSTPGRRTTRERRSRAASAGGSSSWAERSCRRRRCRLRRWCRCSRDRRSRTPRCAWS